MGLLRRGARAKARSTPTPQRLTLPDLRRPRHPTGEFTAWQLEMAAYTSEAEERATRLDEHGLGYTRRALALYFDAGDNDEAQIVTLHRMVSAAVRLGQGFAGVDKVLGIPEGHADPRVSEARALACTQGATGLPPSESQILGVCADVGHFMANIPTMEESMMATIMRNVATDKARDVMAELRESR